MTDHDDLLDELRRRADHVHTHTPRAAAPPPGIWQQVLASVQSQSEEKEQPEMMIQPALATPTGVVRRAFVPRSVSRFTSIAASLLVVATIAFSGWFAAMNLQPGGGSDPRYASVVVKRETAGDGVCDVEPLTVEQAVEIVRDPVAVVYGDSEAFQANGPDVLFDFRNWIGAQTDDWDTLMALASYTAIPVTDDEYFSLMAFAEEYKDCLKVGTFGQRWAMTDPIKVQYEIMTRIPLLQPLDVTEAAIAELLEWRVIGANQSVVVTRQWQPNPDRTLMVRVDAGVTFSSQSSFIIPWQILDGEGEILGSYDIFGNSLLDEHFSDTDPGNLVVIRAKDGKSWYIVGAFGSSQYADVPEE